MATYTAQILVGYGHPNDDGLTYVRQPHVFWLSENSRPCWSICHGGQKHVWVPRRPDSILDDGILMVSAFVFDMPNLTDALEETKVILSDRHVELSTSLSDKQHKNLITLVKHESDRQSLKAILSVFAHSSLLSTIHRLADYSFQVEVLRPSYTRLYNRWRDAVLETGSLAPTDNMND